MFNHRGFAWSFAYHVWCNGISCQEKSGVKPGSQTRAGAFARSPTSLCSSKGHRLGPLGFNNAIERSEKSRRFWTVTVFAGECVRVCKTTDTRRQLPVLLTLIHRDDESYFPITMTIMEDIWLRETIHCAKGGILYFFFSAKTSFQRTKRAIFPFILA